VKGLNDKKNIFYLRDVVPRPTNFLERKLDKELSLLRTQ